jgi:hypothetical protein
LYAHKFSWKSISVEIVERKIESIAPGRVGHAGTSPISLGSPAGPLHRSSHELHPVETAETAVSAAFLFGVPERLDRAVELFLKRLLAVVKQQAGWPRPEKYAESGSFVSGLHSGFGGRLGSRIQPAAVLILLPTATYMLSFLPCATKPLFPFAPL